MIKVLDVPGAVGLRRYPPGLAAELPFRLAGDFLTENDGGYLRRRRHRLCARSSSLRQQ